MNAEQVEVEMVLMLEINSPSKCFTKERMMQVRPGFFILHIKLKFNEHKLHMFRCCVD